MKAIEYKIWERMKKFGLPKDCIIELIETTNCNTSIGTFKVKEDSTILYTKNDNSTEILKLLERDDTNTVRSVVDRINKAIDQVEDYIESVNHNLYVKNYSLEEEYVLINVKNYNDDLELKQIRIAYELI